MNREKEEELLRVYMPLVERTVNQMKKKLPHSVDRNELISFGMTGLLDAIRKNPEGPYFEPYAMQRIRGEILDGLRQNDVLSRSLRKKERDMKAAFEALEKVYGREPTDGELCEYLGITQKEYEHLIMQLSFEQPQSLFEPIHQDDEKQLRIDVLIDHNTISHDEAIIRKEQKKRLAELIDALPEKEKLVIALVYYENLSYSEIGTILDLHKSRISQLHAQAIKKLKAALGKEEVI
jgi:RNA polymerase sigma factor for flagellar operon FliA